MTVPKKKICTSKPIMIDRNCSFVVDIQCLAEIDDIFADDCGAWICTGSPKYFFEEKRSKGSSSLKRIGCGGEVVKNLKKPWYEVVLYYHKNKSSPDFKRTVTFIKGKWSCRM